MGTYQVTAQRGVLLTPSTGSAVWLGAAAVDIDIASSGFVHVVPFRESPIVVMAKGRHLESGVISGRIIAANEDGTAGDDVDAFTWVARLKTLLDNAANPEVTVALTSVHFTAANVMFPSGLRGPRLVHNDTPMFDFDLPFQEIA